MSKDKAAGNETRKRQTGKTAGLQKLLLYRQLDKTRQREHLFKDCRRNPKRRVRQHKLVVCDLYSVWFAFGAK